MATQRALARRLRGVALAATLCISLVPREQADATVGPVAFVDPTDSTPTLKRSADGQHAVYSDATGISSIAADGTVTRLTTGTPGTFYVSGSGAATRLIHFVYGGSLRSVGLDGRNAISYDPPSGPPINPNVISFNGPGTAMAFGLLSPTLPSTTSIYLAPIGGARPSTPIAVVPWTVVELVVSADGNSIAYITSGPIGYERNLWIASTGVAPQLVDDFARSLAAAPAGNAFVYLQQGPYPGVPAADPPLLLRRGSFDSVATIALDEASFGQYPMFYEGDPTGSVVNYGSTEARIASVSNSFTPHSVPVFGYAQFASWVADGQLITSRFALVGGTLTFRVSRSPISGGAETVIAGPSPHLQLIDHAANGTFVYTDRTASGDFATYVQTLDGRPRSIIEQGASLGIVGLSSDGRHAFIRTGTKVPYRLNAMPVAGGPLVDLGPLSGRLIFADNIGTDRVVYVDYVTGERTVRTALYRSTPAPPPPPPVPAAVSVSPGRVLDSRGPGLTVDGLFSGIGVRPAKSITEVQIAGRGGVPADAVTAVLNVTVTGAQGGGYVTVFPCGEPVPNASNLNYATGDTIPNAVIAKLGAGGKVCIYTDAATHLIADVNAYFPTGSAIGSLTPGRLLDTRAPNLTVDNLFSGAGLRPAKSITELQITGRGGVPADATSVMLNVTATGATGSGFITVFPCGETVPNASNLNYTTGDTIANAVITKIGGGGKVCLYVDATTHLIADVNAYVRAGSSFTTLTPGRLLDSRAPALTVDGLFSGIGVRPAKSITELQVTGRGGVPSTATSVVLNVTVTGAAGSGFITVFPCGEPVPNASNLNFATGDTIPNAVIAKLGTGGKVCFYADAGTHLIADVNAYING
jgi:hypothetical protein